MAAKLWRCQSTTPSNLKESGHTNVLRHCTLHELMEDNYKLTALWNFAGSLKPLLNLVILIHEMGVGFFNKLPCKPVIVSSPNWWFRLNLYMKFINKKKMLNVGWSVRGNEHWDLLNDADILEKKRKKEEHW